MAAVRMKQIEVWSAAEEVTRLPQPAGLPSEWALNEVEDRFWLIAASCKPCVEMNSRLLWHPPRAVPHVQKLRRLIMRPWMVLI